MKSGLTVPSIPRIDADRSHPTRGPITPVVRWTREWLREPWWLACWGLIGAWAIGYLTWPFSYDQGVLSWVGRTIADGGLPYRDAWEIRGPFPFLVYAAIAKVFGSAQWPLRAVDLAILSCGLWCAARLARSFGGSFAAKCAVALYVLWYASLGHHDTAQSDGWNAVMIAGVMVALFARDGLPTARHAAVAGALIGLCILSKPTYAIYLALPGLVGLLQVRTRGVAWLARFWGAGVIALAAVTAGILLWLHAGRALGDLIDIHLRWLLSHYTNVEFGWMNRAQRAASYLTADAFATATAPAVLGACMVWRRSRTAAALLIAWVVSAIAGVMAQGNFFAYHWHPLYPAFAMLAGIGIASLFSMAHEAQTRSAMVPAMAFAGVMFFAAALRPAVHVYRSAEFAVGLISRERFEAIEFGPYGLTGPFAQLSRYFRTHTTPKQSVLVWGLAPGVYYGSGRQAPSRFGYVTPLIGEHEDDFLRRYQRDFLAHMSASPPAYVATLAPSVCANARRLDERKSYGPAAEMMLCMDEFPALARMLSQRYVADSSIGVIAMYRLQPSANRAARPPVTSAGDVDRTRR